MLSIKCSKCAGYTRWSLWSFVSLLAVIVGWNAPAAELGGTAKLAPNWELKDLNGRTVRSSDFKGKVVILDFWATWCPPCRAEIPGFVELQKQYGKDDVVVIGISLDDTKASVVRKFTDKLAVNYRVVLGDQDTTRAFGGIDAIPTTFIIDREGRIVSQHLGFTEKADLERDIKPLLNH